MYFTGTEGRGKKHLPWVADQYPVAYQRRESNESNSGDKQETHPALPRSLLLYDDRRMK